MQTSFWQPIPRFMVNMRYWNSILVFVLSTSHLQAAFIVEAHETRLASDRFEFGGDTISASASIPSQAIGFNATNSIYGGDGIGLPDTYIFFYQPGKDEDNFLPSAGRILGSRDGSPGEWIQATGLFGGTSGLYNVYITSPASVNVSGVPTTITITQAGDDIVLEIDQNNGMTGDNTAPPGNAFVGGMNNAWSGAAWHRQGRDTVNQGKRKLQKKPPLNAIRLSKVTEFNVKLIWPP